MSTIEADNIIEVVNTSSHSAPFSLKFDPARYAAEVDEFDMTEAQKQELLSTLWSIMRSFVELGFTVDLCTALTDDINTIPSDGDLG